MLNPLHVLTLPYSLINIKSIRHILTCWFWFVVRQLVITVNYNIYKIYPTKCTSTGSYQLDVVYKCCRCVALLGNSDTFQPKLMFYAEDHNYGFVKFVHNLLFLRCIPGMGCILSLVQWILGTLFVFRSLKRLLLKNWKTDQDHGEVRDNCRAENDKDHSDRLERAINISFCWTFTVKFVYKYILVCCFFCLKTVTYIIVYYCSIPSAIKIEQRGGINIVKIVRFITLYSII